MNIERIFNGFESKYKVEKQQELLEARLTSLMEEFIEVVEELGFTY